MFVFFLIFYVCYSNFFKKTPLFVTGLYNETRELFFYDKRIDFSLIRQEHFVCFFCFAFFGFWSLILDVEKIVT